MAISSDLNGVTISLVIDNQELPEQDFPDPDSEERTVNRLVEAQSQQIFQVQMTVAPDTVFTGSELVSKVFVDGRQIDEPLVNIGVLGMGFPFTETSLGSYVSSTMVRKYQFADISTVEQQSHSISSRSHSVRNIMSFTSANSYRSASTSSNTESQAWTPMTSVSGMSGSRSASYTGGPMTPSLSADGYVPRELLDLGTIKVEVRHVNKQEAVGFGPGGDVGRNFGNGAKNEANFTAPAKTTTVQTWSVENVPGVANPAATFISHYRSKEGLESMLALAAQSVEGPSRKDEESEQKAIKLESVTEEEALENVAAPVLRRSSRHAVKHGEDMVDAIEIDETEEDGRDGENKVKVQEE
ncbi:hypothetical protein DOTSEDRAFT_27699 [Dothistroma septosporum NZE10]|uniref:DUF7918 domain-containing protein n=1 Tax=Dothistroma septosporum (strain NZE10 / CBS 128990) TaxID=675120 RepID=N1PG87_DOTSN|nr:hypothetical protein DOTSEDRAFT_27699 [Dothistroma septosporum NZE10]